MKIYDYDGKKNVSGERIREYRLKNRLSQSDLSAKLQIENVMIDCNSISRIESGKRFVTDYELRALAHVLHTTINILVDDTEH